MAGVVGREGEQRSELVLTVLADVFLMDVGATDAAGTSSHVGGIAGGANCLKCRGNVVILLKKF